MGTMDKQVVVSARTLVLVGAVAVALLTAFFLGKVGGGGEARAADGDPSTRTVTVQGIGHVSVVPDELAFTIGMEVSRPDLATALGDANASMQKVVDALTARGVAKEDVQTSGLSMYPNYARKGQTVTGYTVSQSVSATVKDLESGSDVVTAAVTAGGEGVRLDDLHLQVSDPEGSLAPARTAALEQAKAKAAAYAGDVGADLGSVVRVSEVSSDAAAYDQRASYAAADSASGSVPIEAGATDLAASVTVVFALE